MKLKICGMKYADNIREVSGLSPDYMGFIFYPKSRRYVGEDFIMPEISSEIRKVGVFVNDPIGIVLEQIKKHGLDCVQLHGDESAEFCKKTREKTRVIKAFGLDEQFDFSSLNEYESYCDHFLFDTRSEEYGGSGKSFDKNILKNYKLQKPFFLSGGIDREEFRIQNPEARRAYALDVNSKFEIEPGLKDIDKLKTLISSLKGSQ